MSAPHPLAAIHTFANLSQNPPFSQSPDRSDHRLPLSASHLGPHRLSRDSKHRTAQLALYKAHIFRPALSLAPFQHLKLRAYHVPERTLPIFAQMESRRLAIALASTDRLSRSDRWTRNRETICRRSAPAPPAMMDQLIQRILGISGRSIS